MGGCGDQLEEVEGGETNQDIWENYFSIKEGKFGVPFIHPSYCFLAICQSCKYPDNLLNLLWNKEEPWRLHEL